MPSSKYFSALLLDWYDKHGRNELPWRKDILPYRVWLSEIMLQQTQVKTVLPYYQNFLQHFPTITDLAQAQLDQVLQLWSGLGYYTRARNLYKTAQIIVSEYSGNFPDVYEDIIKLPGIGRSTAGAILAIAFEKPYAILDGNVRRILARFFQISGWPGDPKIQKHLWDLSETLLPKQRIGDYTQAIMDLGATICTMGKNPACHLCPVSQACQAFKHDTVSLFPEKRPQKQLPHRHKGLIILLDPHGRILLERRPETGIWGGLWSLPEHAAVENQAIMETLFHQLGHILSFEIQHPEIQHSFSHYHLTLYPFQYRLPKHNSYLIGESSNQEWFYLSEALKLGLPSPIKKFLRHLSML